MNGSEQGYWICASYQHVRSFAESAPNIAEFEVTSMAGQAVNVINAVRGRTSIDLAELERVSRAQGIGKRRLVDLLSALERLSFPRLLVQRTQAGQVTGIEEHLGSLPTLYELASALWESLEPTLVERAAIHILKHTCVLPRPRAEELGLLVKDGFKDQDAAQSVDISTSFGIVRPFSGAGLAEPILFNEYVWRKHQDKLSRAFSVFSSNERATLEAAVGMTAASQGIAADRLSVPQELLTTAQSLGFFDTVRVQTASGDIREFVFSPHLTTHPDTTQLADDLLNDVRAVLACVGYGEHYSRISRLGGISRDKTINFLAKLLREQRAGDATAIGVDYTLLEERGVITVERTPTPPGGRYAMVLLRREPVEVALRVVEESASRASALPQLVNTRTLDPASLFAGPEETRTKVAFGKQPEPIREARNYFLKKIRKEVF